MSDVYFCVYYSRSRDIYYAILSDRQNRDIAFPGTWATMHDTVDAVYTKYPNAHQWECQKGPRP